MEPPGVRVVLEWRREKKKTVRATQVVNPFPSDTNIGWVCVRARQVRQFPGERRRRRQRGLRQPRGDRPRRVRVRVRVRRRGHRPGPGAPDVDQQLRRQAGLRGLRAASAASAARPGARGRPGLPEPVPAGRQRAAEVLRGAGQV